MSAFDTAKASLAAASLVDSRTPKPDANVVRMWAKIIGDVPLADAMAVVEQHYSAPGVERIMPGDIRAGVAKIRSQRVKDNYEDFPELDAYADDAIAWKTKLLELRGEVADGTYGQRDHSGLPARDVTALAKRTIAALPAMPKYDAGSAARAKTLAAFDAAIATAKYRRVTTAVTTEETA